MADSNNSSDMQSMIKSPKERKEILRTTLNRALSLRERNEYLAIDDLKSLEEVMKEGNDAILENSFDETMSNQEEIFLDSEAINISSKILIKCTKSVMENISSYNYVDFASKLAC